MEYGNSFSRTKYNEAKAGAYYTDVKHCVDISKFLKFPSEHFDVLEPSCGDCSAVRALTYGAYENCSIYGVELNDSVVKEVIGQKIVEKIICADFLSSVEIHFKNSSQKFPLVFSNPPYMAESDADGNFERLEDKFLRNIITKMSKGGVLVWVVPEKVFTEESRYILNNFFVKHLFRFRPREYEKYHQVVGILVKRDASVITASDDVKAFKDSIPSIKELPETSEGYELVEVQSSDADNLELFTSKIFNPVPIKEALMNNKDFFFKGTKNVTNEWLTQRPYKSTTLRNPLVTLSEGHIVTCVTCGEGSGLTGIPGENLHLQRGYCEIVEQQVENFEEGESDGVVEVTSYAKVKNTIIQPSGKILRFE